MNVRLRAWAPEFLIAGIALFFAFRELGTFPAPWEDSGLYSLIAKSLATGHGYTLHILNDHWRFPYFVSVGPTVIAPVALMIALFGNTTEAMRLVPVAYMLGTCVLFYVFVRGASDRWAARWSTSLLITLSAFVNNGKPVLGSVPALFFVFLGLVLWQRMRPTAARSVAIGLCFGLAILTKFTFILILPALGFTIISLWRHGEAGWRRNAAKTALAAFIFVPWLFLITNAQPGFEEFLVTVFTRASRADVASFVGDKAALALRFQYQYFAVILALGLLGLRRAGGTLHPAQRTFVGALSLLFLAHFLLREGWYRHLLPAHVLLLLFAPAGLLTLMPRKAANVVLIIIVMAQAWWQLDHRGSSRSTASIEAATIIERDYADRGLLIQHPEIFMRLSENPRWLYYPLPGTAELMPAEFLELTPEQRCFPVLRKANDADRAEFGDRVQDFPGKYNIILPPPSCGTAE